MFYNTCWYIDYFLWTITSDHIVQRSHDTGCHSHTFVVCHVTRDIHPIIYPEFKSTSRNGRSVIPLAVAWIAIPLMCMTTLPYVYTVHLKLLKHEWLVRIPKVLIKGYCFHSLDLNAYLILMVSYVIIVI